MVPQSEEDLALKEQLELYVVRAQDADPGVQKLALESSWRRVNWSEADTLLLYEYCVEEIESSSLEELSIDSYEIITKKLCYKGVNHNIKSVKEKVRGTKKLYTFWKEKVMNPLLIKDEKWWAKEVIVLLFKSLRTNI